MTSAPSARPTICLTMIVKDEAHVVAETLTSMLRYVTDFVITDTGSTDGTQQVVRELLAAANIPGLVFERPWRDFGHNRTEALELARRHSTSDYLWMIDADDLLVGEPEIESLTLDGYQVRIGPSFEYWRPQIFKRPLPWRYVGVLHEYATCDGDPKIGLLPGSYYIESRRLGSRSRAADKYARDADILTTAVQAEPDNARNVFYLAQSHFDAGNIAAALQTYRQRAGMGGWVQEVFYSRFRIAQCLERLDRPFADVQSAYLDCFRHHPWRAEPLVEAARRARLAGDFASAYEHARRAHELPHPGPQALFVHGDAYDYRAADEQAIAAYYLGRHEEAVRLDQELLIGNALPQAERPRVECNRDFSVPYVLDTLLQYDPELIARIRARPQSTEPQVTVSITTCKRLDLFIRTMTSFLNVCEDIDHVDAWICVDDNSSDSDRAEMQRLFPFFEFVWKGPSDKGHARSMNLIRNRVRTPFLLHLEDDWQFFARRGYVQPALEILRECPDVGQLLFNRNYAETLAEREVPGGHLAVSWEHGYRFRIHEHYAPDTEEYRRFQAAHGGRPNSAYWPHYSLRPSILKTAVLERLGAYDESSAHFELDYAQRYAGSGFRSAFLDGVHCLHIGRLTSERSDPTKQNAYTLNAEEQFERRKSIRIKLLSHSWGSSEELCRDWNKMSRGNYRWNRIEVTWEDHDIDFYAVFNAPPADAHLVPERTIVFQMEPETGTPHLPVEWRAPEPERFYQVRRQVHFPNVSEWHLSKTYEELSTLPIAKTRLLSTVTSSRCVDPGQQLRVAFIHHWQERGGAMDVYGRTNEQGFKNHLGALPTFQKDDGLLPYKYTFAAENQAAHNYFTEKIVDAILAECLCFYWGCPNLADYVDPEAFIELDLNDFDAAVATIESAIAAGEWERRIDAIRSAKRSLLDLYQVFPTLERIVSAPAVPDIAVINLDRRPDRMQRFETRATRAGLRKFRRVTAVDGATLRMNDRIRHLFRNNNHGYRRGIVGCALSHLRLWRTVQAPLLIFEDDVELSDDFLPKLQSLLDRVACVDPHWDIILLGFTPWPQAATEPASPTAPRLTRVDWSKYMGGSFAYLLSPTGARKLLNRLTRNGMQHAVDWFVMHQAAHLRAYSAAPAIAWSPSAHTIANADTDIQGDHGRLS